MKYNYKSLIALSLTMEYHRLASVPGFHVIEAAFEFSFPKSSLDFICLWLATCLHQLLLNRIINNLYIEIGRNGQRKEEGNCKSEGER